MERNPGARVGLMDTPSHDWGRCTDCGGIVPFDSLIEHTIDERPDGFIGLCTECVLADPGHRVGTRRRSLCISAP
jgi:hypothetical protein